MILKTWLEEAAWGWLVAHEQKYNTPIPGSAGGTGGMTGRSEHPGRALLVYRPVQVHAIVNCLSGFFGG